MYVFTGIPREYSLDFNALKTFSEEYAIGAGIIQEINYQNICLKIKYSFFLQNEDIYFKSKSDILTFIDLQKTAIDLLIKQKKEEYVFIKHQIEERKAFIENNKYFTNIKDDNQSLINRIELIKRDLLQLETKQDNISKIKPDYSEDELILLLVKKGFLDFKY